MSMKNFSLILLLFLICGCTTVPAYEADVRTNFEAIPMVDKVTLEHAVPAAKPVPQFTEEEAILNVAETRKLLSLVKQNREVVAERNSLVDLSNRVIDDRNTLLLNAQAEEHRANVLSTELEAERDVRASEQRKASVERSLSAGAVTALLILLVL